MLSCFLVFVFEMQKPAQSNKKNILIYGLCFPESSLNFIEIGKKSSATSIFVSNVFFSYTFHDHCLRHNSCVVYLSGKKENQRGFMVDDDSASHVIWKFIFEFTNNEIE